MAELNDSIEKCFHRGGDWDLLWLGLLTIHLEHSEGLDKSTGRNKDNLKLWRERAISLQTIGKRHYGIDLFTMLQISCLTYECEKKRGKQQNMEFVKQEMDQITSNNNRDSFNNKQSSLQAQQEWKVIDYDFSCTKSMLAHPAHFLVTRTLDNPETNKQTTQVVLAIRGTVTSTDIMTCLLADTMDYRGGKVHKGMYQSGMWLVRKYKYMLFRLCDEALTRNGCVELTIIGHSLGAGAATVAGIELRDELMKRYPPQFCSVEVLGFGGPSVLSESLSKQVSSFVTTVVVGEDVVPCVSEASIRNMFATIGGYAQDKRKVSATTMKKKNNNKWWVGPLRHLHARLLKRLELPPESKIELFPAGVCIHVKNNDFGRCGAWYVDCKYFGVIELGPNMAGDHHVKKSYETMIHKVLAKESTEYSC